MGEDRTRWSDERIDDLASIVRATSDLPANVASFARSLEAVDDRCVENRKMAKEEHDFIHRRIDSARSETEAQIDRVRTTIRNTLLGLGVPVATAVVLRVLNLA